jgi:alkanesulfonate monooxygenase SsuD/methylene tetrahydromethanopterin reductase-like flavin-dependent oxidoreductase (luciferase family)
VWTAEAYCSDALSPLAYLAAITDRVKLGTGVIQLAARTPANAAMTIATIDALAGGNRVICGIGVSGPQNGNSEAMELMAEIARLNVEPPSKRLCEGLGKRKQGEQQVPYSE